MHADEMRGSVSIIGVGPGDPELLTLRALKTLKQCELVVHAGPFDRAGYAFDTIGRFLEPEQVVESAGLTMKRGAVDGSIGYERVALRLAEWARAGRKGAFLTEGDPMLYGSGSYIVERLRTLAPDVSVEIIPGVNAVSAAAARIGWPLAQKEEIVTICPTTYHIEEIGPILDRPGTSCWLKAADVLPALIVALEARNRLHRAALIEKVGRSDERIFLDLRAAQGEDLSYFSLVLVR